MNIRVLALAALSAVMIAGPVAADPASRQAEPVEQLEQGVTEVPKPQQVSEAELAERHQQADAASAELTAGREDDLNFEDYIYIGILVLLLAGLAGA